MIAGHSSMGSGVRPSSPPKAIPGNRITTVKDLKETFSVGLPNQTGSMTSRGYDRGGAKDRGGTVRQWQSTVPDVEPLTPIQMTETNKFLQLESSPERVKLLAGLKNNSYSPPALQEKPEDTRQMPGTRTGSKLSIHNKLYYNVNQRKLRQEDREWQKAEELRLKGAKGDGTPKIRYISEKGFKSPAEDSHTLPPKSVNAMPGL